LQASKQLGVQEDESERLSDRKQTTRLEELSCLARKGAARTQWTKRRVLEGKLLKNEAN